MKRRAALLALLPLLAVPLAAAARVRTRAQTMTRLVRVFLDLETALFEAQHAGDRAALERLLVDDFEQRDAAAPGQPLPRAEWLVVALRDAPADVELDQMAVHDRGDTAIVSFIARPEGRAAAFIVDVWVKAAVGWQVKVRYAAPGPRA